jgi:two-component system sensor kinase FixL
VFPDARSGLRDEAAIVKWAGLTDRLSANFALVLGPASMPRVGPTIATGTVAAGVIVVYVLLEWVSFIHEHKGVPITPWNPALGLVVAFMVLFGLRYAAVLFAGAVIAEIAVLRSNLAWPVILGISGIIAGGYGLVAETARRYLRLDAGLSRLHDIVVLLLSGFSGALLVALLICLVLLADNDLDLSDVLVAAGPLLIGDTIGIAVMTPLTLRLALHPRPLLDRLSLRIVPEVLIFLLTVIAALWVIVVAAGPSGSKLFYLLFLPVMVAAARYGLDGACIGLAVTQFGLVGLLHHYGYDADAFTEFQLLMLVLSATGLIVGVTVTERQHAFETVREVEAELKAKEMEAAQAARFNLVSGTAAALAHEINQPMTAARALARSVQQIMRGQSIDLARAHTNLAELIAQIDHAGGIVRHMRDFLRRGRPHSSTIELRPMLHDAVALAAAELTAKGVTIAIDTPDDLPVIHGDAVQLREVILNLVRNAAEAIDDAHIPDGRIAVTAQLMERPARIEIAVADNGPGIAPGMAEHLFHPLTTSKSDGLGLGLSISAEIIQAHGGRIWLQRGAPRATEFRFSLPVESR